MKHIILCASMLSLLSGCVPACCYMVDKSCRYKNPEEFRPVKYECECSYEVEAK